MNKRYFKNCIYGFVCLSAVYLGYRWDQARKLENYFIDEICLDAQLQAHKGERLLNGPLFDQTCAEMKELGYNPYKIQQVVFKGYEKALEKEKREREANDFISKIKD